jgi:uncharacterized membrane protein
MKYFNDFRGLGSGEIRDIFGGTMERIEENRVKQVVIGASVLIAIGVVVPGALVGWRFIPGVIGEWIGMITGILTTPFFMETTFVILGLVIVVTLNHWRRIKDGDEFVYLEQVDGPETPKDLPDQATWAVFLEKPLDAAAPSLLEQAEGAFAIGDYEATAEWIGAMEPAELKQQDTLSLRLQLAQATGHEDRVKVLEDEIRRAKTSQG